MTPGVSISKSDGNTGAVKPSADGVLVIIAASESGTANQPSTYTRAAQAVTDFGRGPLTEFGAYTLANSKKPVVLIKGTTSTAAAYGSITTGGAGTSVLTAGATAPLDDFNVLITFVAGGTIGVTGITYTESLDGGVTTGPVRSLGTATTLTVLDGQGNATGVSLALAAGTILAAETASFSTTAAQMTTSDLNTALEALRTSSQPWEAILFYGVGTAAYVTALDTWLAALEPTGKFRTAVIGSRLKNSGESEATYKTAMQTAYASASSTRVVVCTDGGDLLSAIRGIVQPRSSALAVAARGMAIDISRDCANVSDGPVPGFVLTDARGNTKYHDEMLFPGLDDLRLTALRSFDGRNGAYINNPNLISPSGSDYVYWQHARVMNKACELAFQLLTTRLSSGVQKDGSGHILETDAEDIESLVQGALDANLVTPKRVSQCLFQLSRNDDLTPNSGATVTATISIVALSYIKQFSVTTKFVKTIAVPTT